MFRIDRTLCLFVALLAGLTGCAKVATTTGASNHRNWTPDQALLATADIRKDEVLVHNVRNCHYLSADEYFADYYDRLVKLDDLTTVDFVLVPFQNMPSMGHTMLSFGTRDGERLAVSVEIRKEQGESFSVVQGLANQFEIMYVVADERDVIDLRAVHRGDDVYVYPLRASPEQVRKLFVNMMKRANDLARQPEFYNTVTNNCTNAIVRHFNELSKRPVSEYDPRVILPGYSDRLAYDLGIINTDLPFEETRKRANVSPLARQKRAEATYSQAIRQSWSAPAARF